MNPDVTWSLLPAAVLRYSALRRMERWDHDRIGRRADELLRRLVRHAARHVPYYRTLFREIGLDPATFRGRADLPRIPPLDKKTLRTRLDEFVADDAGRRRAVWKHTSGSTGTPLRFLLDFESRTWDAAAVLRSYGWAGFHPGARSVWIRDYYQTWTYRRSMLGRILVMNPRRIGRETLPELWTMIQDVRPTVLIGYPATLTWIIHLVRTAGLPPLRPRAIITVGETLTAATRARLTEFFGGARVFDYYGMSENAALISECAHGTRHALDDYAWHEFVDESGRPVTEGRSEVLGTAYHNLAMPLIRYRTGDLVRVRSAAWRCPCGRAYRAVASIDGRRDDMILTPDGRCVTLIGDVIEHAHGVLASQIVQEHAGLLHVNYLADTELADADREQAQGILQTYAGPDMRLEFRRVRALEQRGGKTPFILSRLPDARGCAADGDA